MKQNINLSGDLEFSHSEITKILLDHANKNRKILTDAFTSYLQSSFGYTLNKLSLTSTDSGEMTLQVQVSSTETAKEPSKKKNLGFYKELVDYLIDHTNEKNKTVKFDDLFSSMSKQFPDLTKRLFTIYCSDTRRQRMTGFSYDSRRKTLGLGYVPTEKGKTALFNDIIDRLREAGKFRTSWRKVHIDEVFESVTKLAPGLTKTILEGYVANKDRQKAKGFMFDPESKMLNLK